MTYRKIAPDDDCLQGTAAVTTFLALIEGERGSRAYTTTNGNEYGYFFSIYLDKWVAFDNRQGTLFVAYRDDLMDAWKLLRDGEELLSA